MKLLARSLLLVLISLPTASCSSVADLHWSFAPYEGSTQMNLEQARSICMAAAKRAGKSASDTFETPYRVNCSGTSWGGAFSGSCGKSTSPGGELLTMLANREEAKSAYKSVFVQCMAENGWRAWVGSGTAQAHNVSMESETEMISKYNDWAAYIIKERSGKVERCFAVNEGSIIKLFITVDPLSENAIYTSVQGDGTQRTASRVEVTVGGEKFRYIIKGQEAWLPYDEDDLRIADLIKNSANMKVSILDPKNITLYEDRIGLDGSKAAIDSALEACNLKP